MARCQECTEHYARLKLPHYSKPRKVVYCQRNENKLQRPCKLKAAEVTEGERDE